MCIRDSFCIIVAFGSEAVTKFPNADFVLAVLALATVNVGATVANAKTANVVNPNLWHKPLALPSIFVRQVGNVKQNR